MSEIRRIEEPFTWVERRLLEEEPEATSSDLVVYLVLANHCKQGSRSSFPSRKKIAEMSRLSVRTIDRSISHLQEIGWLRVESRFRNNGERGSNIYILGKATSDRGGVTVAPPRASVTGGGDTSATAEVEAGKEKKEVDVPAKAGSHRRVTDLYCSLWRGLVPGETPIWTAAEGKQLKTLLAKKPEAEVIETLEEFFLDSDSYVADRGYPFLLFVNRYNQYRVQMAKGRKRSTKAKSLRCPACQTEIIGTMGSCPTCWLPRSRFDDPAAVEEHSKRVPVY